MVFDIWSTNTFYGPDRGGQGPGYQPRAQKPDFSRFESSRHHHPLIWYQYQLENSNFLKKGGPTPLNWYRYQHENPDFLKKGGPTPLNWYWYELENPNFSEKGGTHPLYWQLVQIMREFYLHRILYQKLYLKLHSRIHYK